LNQFTPNDVDRHHSALAKQVDSVIRKRLNSICHYPVSTETQQSFFSIIYRVFFQFAKSLLAFDLKLSDVPCSHAG